MSSIFNPKGKPWINVEGTSSEEIMKQINQCPSEALSYYKNSEGKKVYLDVIELTKVEVIPNGPARVHGDVEITYSNGTVEKKNVLLPCADAECLVIRRTAMELTNAKDGKKANRGSFQLALHSSTFMHRTF